MTLFLIGIILGVPVGMALTIAIFMLDAEVYQTVALPTQHKEPEE